VKSPEQIQREAEEKKIALELKKSKFQRITEAKQKVGFFLTCLLMLKALFTPVEPKIPASTYRQMKKMKGAATAVALLNPDEQ
jgi:hypothetical protein